MFCPDICRSKPDLVESFNYDKCYKPVYRFLKNVEASLLFQKLKICRKPSNYFIKYIIKQLISATKGEYRYLCSKNLEIPFGGNVGIEDKDFFLNLVKVNQNVYYEKLYVNGEMEQEIIYIQMKK